MHQTQIPFHAELVGDIEQPLRQLTLQLGLGSSRSSATGRAQREKMRIRILRTPLPHRVVELTAEVYREPGHRGCGRAHVPGDVSLARLRTQRNPHLQRTRHHGVRIASAIGAALLDRTKPVIAFTGDGGLLICLGELSTAAREARSGARYRL